MFELIRKKAKIPFIKVTQNTNHFDDSNGSMDHLLHKLSMRYTESIARNDDLLKSIKYMVNAPIVFFLVGVCIIFLLLPTPAPSQQERQPAQSAPASPLPTK